MVIYKPVIFMSTNNSNKTTKVKGNSNESNANGNATINISGADSVSTQAILKLIKTKAELKKRRMDMMTSEIRTGTSTDALRIEAQAEYLCLSELLAELESLLS